MTDDKEGLLQQKENQLNTSFICNKKETQFGLNPDV